MEVVISAAEDDDIGAAFVWYRERNLRVDDTFRAAVFDLIGASAQSPLSRPPDEEINRHRVMHRFPYSVNYDVVETTIIVFAVARHRRRPGDSRQAKP